ncbi:MAG: hypothetical protein KH586_12355 [Tannerella sp.]|uniref:DUF6249 domain-containing protein n=1 Tax=uncultured Coprobacter sp. TaxID=1720550 RepID=UPI00260EB9BC|nr:DUF6249 domain-containing protein [uncultured Coprobacter sp.]MBS6269709.1 hypothetical protein [Tannerella sp.]
MKMMKKAILLFVVAFISILSNGICVAENNPTVPDSINSQEKTELALLKMKQNHELMMPAVSDDKKDVLLPIVAIVFVFGVPVIVLFLILFFALRYKLKLQKERYAVVEKAIECGRELPDSFFEESSSKKPLYSKKRLSTALTLIALGIGILFFGLVAENKYVWAFSVIPILIGLGQLLVYRIEEKSRIEELFKEEQNINEQE